jgi:hypothetical protein
MHNWTNNNETFVAQFLQKGITLSKVEPAKFTNNGQKGSGGIEGHPL